MKNKIVKFLFVFLLLITPLIYSAQSVHGVVLVKDSKVNLSPEFLLNHTYLNSPNIRKYILKRMKSHGHLPNQSIMEILNSVEFFCDKNDLYNEYGQVNIYIKMPKNPGQEEKILWRFQMGYARHEQCA